MSRLTKTDPGKGWVGGYEWGRTELALYALHVLLHALEALQALQAHEVLSVQLLALQVLPALKALLAQSPTRTKQQTATALHGKASSSIGQHLDTARLPLRPDLSRTISKRHSLDKMKKNGV